MNKIKALLSCAVAPAFLLVPASATLQTAQSYFPGLNDNDKDVYTQWLKNKFSSYSRDAFLPSTEDHENGAAVFWDIEEEDISFAVAVRATGWLGFGISEAGGMLGADVVTFQALSLDSSSKEVSKRRSGALPSTELVDSYILEDRAAPLVDDCQDWILKSATTEGGWIIIEMSRKLDTGDKQDRQIRNDADLWNAPTHLISAWGDMDDISNHGSNRARLSVRLFATDSNNKDDSNKSTLSDKLLKHSDGYFDLREDDYEVPQNETTYHHYCKSFDELKLDLNLPQDQSMVTMIGAQPILSEDTASLVHHFVVYSRKDCNFEDFVMPTMVYLWAPGDDGLLLPDDVGFPLFDRDSQQALMIEIHYNNPYGFSGKIDSSGVRFYFTYEERDHRAGILQLGDPFVSLEGEEIKSGLTRYEFSCPGICSSSFLGDQKVTVLAESLHMHKSGVCVGSIIMQKL